MESMDFLVQRSRLSFDSWLLTSLRNVAFGKKKQSRDPLLASSVFSLHSLEGNLSAGVMAHLYPMRPVTASTTSFSLMVLWPGGAPW